MEAVEPIRRKTEIKRMKRLLKQRNLRDYALFTLGLNTGLRVGDLLALSVGDVLEGRGVRLKIAKSVKLREHKTGKIKRLMLNETARRALKEYLEVRERRYPEDPLFLSRKHTDDGSLRSVGREQVWRVLSWTAKAVGIKESIGSHTMRKTFGYHLYHSDHSLEHIQKMLNHASPQTTLDYIGITQDEMDDVYLGISL